MLLTELLDCSPWHGPAREHQELRLMSDVGGLSEKRWELACHLVVAGLGRWCKEKRFGSKCLTEI